jgi:hypothetical protein
MQSNDDDLSRPIQPFHSSLDDKIEGLSRETGICASDVLGGREKFVYNHSEFTLSDRHNCQSEKCLHALTALFASPFQPVTADIEKRSRTRERNTWKLLTAGSRNRW